MPIWDRLVKTLGIWLTGRCARSGPFHSSGRLRNPARLSPPPSLRLESLEARNLLSAGTGLTAQYFGDMAMTQLLMMRTDPTVNLNLSATQAPAAGLPTSRYSIRWTGQVEAQFSEAYTFSTMSDDGVRLFINGQKLIDDWNDHAPRQDSATLSLVAGQKYAIEVDYYQNAGGAVAQLLWSSPHTTKQLVPTSQLFPATAVGAGSGLTGSYYKDTSLGSLAQTRTDAQVNFTWAANTSPAAGVPGQNWSARWTGTVQPFYTGTYTFYTTSDDGVRLFVNGQTLVDNWTVHAPVENSGSITLVAGQKYAMQMDFFQAAGGAKAQLLWSGPSTPKQLIPSSQLYPGAATVQVDWFSQNLHDATLTGLARNLYAGDHQLGRSDLLGLFSQTAQDSQVTVNELGDLRTLVANASTLGMPDPVRNLASKVVNGDAANKLYQGHTVGNLYAGGTGWILRNLVNKWFLGLDHPSVPSSVSYVYASGSLFGSGPSYIDVRQGAAADCYYLAGLTETVYRSPPTIRSMFTDNGDGTFTVRFYRNSVADYVTVDRYLPASGGSFYFANAGSPLNDPANKLWVPLAEKAYAQLAESGWSRVATANAYSSINIGWEGTAINHIAAKVATAQTLANNSATFSAIITAFNAGRWVGLDTKSSTAANIVANHVYVMLGYSSSTGLFRLYNPWGYEQQLSWSQVAANFAYWSQNTA